jgi:CRISPR-associated protein Cmr2
VQGFIAAARRTRDLWLGSYLLSEICKAAAKAVKDSGCELIFPCSDDIGRDLAQGSEFNVANVILAEIESDKTVSEISGIAREAAGNRWLDFVDEALEILRKYVDIGAWAYQKKGVIEFNYAWCPFENDHDYRAARQGVARLLAARKNLRDFAPWTGHAGVPKSSLDGLREGVFNNHSQQENIKGIRIKKGEVLDLVGCVKRASGGRATFPSVTRIALDPWIRGLHKKKEKVQTHFDKLMQCCEELCKVGVLSRAKSDIFPYEGTVFLPQRYKEFEEEAGGSPKIKDAINNLREITSSLFRAHKQAPPYLAVLAADGDRMGRAIASIKTPDGHRNFSKTLSRFAGDARRIVEVNHGCCVYTGGDDVLAFLPLDKALACARGLYDSFDKLWKGGEWNFEYRPTLSVGIAIAHALEDLEILLEFGRSAEKLAKNATNDKADERNGLALTVRARGNSEISVREQWRTDSPSLSKLSDLSLDRRLYFWADCFAKSRIPSKFPYELREAARFYENWGNGAMRDEAMRADVIRIFKRKDLQLGEYDEPRVSAYIGDIVRGSQKSITRLADELLVAQWVGDAQKLATGGTV